MFQVPLSGKIKTFEVLNHDSKDRLTLFGQADHVRIYGRDYSDRLRDAGFIVSTISTLHEFGSDVIERYVLIDDEEIFICRKQGEIREQRVAS